MKLASNSQSGSIAYLQGTSAATKRQLVAWLSSLCALIVAMVVVGGITRLTGSGLSIVDWKPLMGAIPPLSTAEWQEAFQRYQEFPQYKLLNHGMTLGEFKSIFFWEYLHRLLGRLIGFAFLIPWLYFVAVKRVEKSLALKLSLAFVLGGLQGALGWFMVKSGLVDKPYVSHFRLAAHLTLALIVLGYLFWILLLLREQRQKGDQTDGRTLRKLVIAFASLLSLQIVYGAFTAGLKAGFGYNTYPKMMENWIAPEAFARAPLWINALETPAMVQFIHRTLGACVLSGAILLWAGSRRLQLRKEQKLALSALAVLVCIQFVLGVSTLLWMVPVSLATLHQLGACLVLLTTLRAIFVLGY